MESKNEFASVRLFLKFLVSSVCFTPFYGLGQVELTRQSWIDDQRVISLEQRQAFFRKLRNETAEVLLSAYNQPKASSRARRIYSDMRERLLRSVFALPGPGEDFEYCKQRPRTWAFVAAGVDSIFICPVFINFISSYEMIRVAGIFLVIHETAHLKGFDREVGVDKECGADMIANSVLLDAGFTLKQRREALEGSGYIVRGRCSISPNDRI